MPIINKNHEYESSESEDETMPELVDSPPLGASASEKTIETSDTCQRETKNKKLNLDNEASGSGVETDVSIKTHPDINPLAHEQKEDSDSDIEQITEVNCDNQFKTITKKSDFITKPLQPSLRKKSESETEEEESDFENKLQTMKLIEVPKEEIPIFINGFRCGGVVHSTLIHCVFCMTWHEGPHCYVGGCTKVVSIHSTRSIAPSTRQLCYSCHKRHIQVPLRQLSREKIFCTYCQKKHEIPSCTIGTCTFIKKQPFICDSEHEHQECLDNNCLFAHTRGKTDFNIKIYKINHPTRQICFRCNGRHADPLKLQYPPLFSVECDYCHTRHSSPMCMEGADCNLLQQIVTPWVSRVKRPFQYPPTNDLCDTCGRRHIPRNKFSYHKQDYCTFCNTTHEYPPCSFSAYCGSISEYQGRFIKNEDIKSVTGDYHDTSIHTVSKRNFKCQLCGECHKEHPQVLKRDPATHKMVDCGCGGLHPLPRCRINRHCTHDIIDDDFFYKGTRLVCCLCDQRHLPPKILVTASNARNSAEQKRLEKITEIIQPAYTSYEHASPAGNHQNPLIEFEKTPEPTRVIKRTDTLGFCMGQPYLVRINKENGNCFECNFAHTPFCNPGQKDISKCIYCKQDHALPHCRPGTCDSAGYLDEYERDSRNFRKLICSFCLERHQNPNPAYRTDKNPSVITWTELQRRLEIQKPCGFNTRSNSHEWFSPPKPVSVTNLNLTPLQTACFQTSNLAINITQKPTEETNKCKECDYKHSPPCKPSEKDKMFCYFCTDVHATPHCRSGDCLTPGDAMFDLNPRADDRERRKFCNHCLERHQISSPEVPDENNIDIISWKEFHDQLIQGRRPSGPQYIKRHQYVQNITSFNDRFYRPRGQRHRSFNSRGRYGQPWEYKTIDNEPTNTCYECDFCHFQFCRPGRDLIEFCHFCRENHAPPYCRPGSCNSIEASEDPDCASEKKNRRRICSHCLERHRHSNPVTEDYKNNDIITWEAYRKKRSTCQPSGFLFKNPLHFLPTPNLNDAAAPEENSATDQNQEKKDKSFFQTQLAILINNATSFKNWLNYMAGDNKPLIETILIILNTFLLTILVQNTFF